MEKATRPVHCKTCSREARLNPPHGWYQLSVCVPENLNPRGYIWLGTFCSVKCLALQVPDIRLASEYTEDLYEHA